MRVGIVILHCRYSYRRYSAKKIIGKE